MKFNVILALITAAVFLPGCKESAKETPPPKRPAGKLLHEFNWQKDVLESREPVAVDFTATWCPPCQEMNPALESISRDFKVCKVDVDKHRDLARAHRASSIPLLIVYKNGNIVARFVGFTSEETLRAELEKWSNQTVP